MSYLQETWGEGVQDCFLRETDDQKWTIETEGDNPNIVAFRNAATGHYLYNFEPTRTCWGTVGVKEEKQLWELSPGKRVPNTCLLRSVASNGAKQSYLNDHSGGYEDNHYVHMWEYLVSDKPMLEGTI